MEQGTLFEPVSAIAQALENAQRRGQRITPWVESVMWGWADRKVQMPQDRPAAERQLWEKYGFTPTPCDCLYCKQPAVIFPPEDGEPLGYCLCPCCSYTEFSGCTHRPNKQHKQQVAG